MAKKLKYDGSDEVVVKYAIKDSHGTDIDVNNLVAIAEGKTKTFILSYSEIVISSSYTYYDISDAIINDPTAYVSGKANKNDLFNNQSDQVFFNTGYIILQKGINSRYIVKDNEIDALIKKGDIILVIEVDVPDRWYKGTNYLQKLETSKIDLTNYYTKFEANVLLSGKVDVNSAQSLLETQKQQARDNIGALDNIIKVDNNLL